MSRYLHTGWHEFLMPALSEQGQTYLRVWVDMADVTVLLRGLDLKYGDEQHPYALRGEDIPHAQRDLLRSLVELLLREPRALRRVAATRQYADELARRFAVEPATYPLKYPDVIDQVDLNPGQVATALPFVVDRAAIDRLPHEEGA